MSEETRDEAVRVLEWWEEGCTAGSALNVVKALTAHIMDEMERRIAAKMIVAAAMEKRAKEKAEFPLTGVGTPPAAERMSEGK